MPFPFPCHMYEGTTGIAVSLLACVIEIPRMQSIVSDRKSSDMVAVGVTDSKPLPQPEVSVRQYFTSLNVVRRPDAALHHVRRRMRQIFD